MDQREARTVPSNSLMTVRVVCHEENENKEALVFLFFFWSRKSKETATPTKYSIFRPSRFFSLLLFVCSRQRRRLLRSQGVDIEKYLPQRTA